MAEVKNHYFVHKNEIFFNRFKLKVSILAVLGQTILEIFASITSFERRRITERMAPGVSDPIGILPKNDGEQNITDNVHIKGS